MKYLWTLYECLPDFVVRLLIDYFLFSEIIINRGAEFIHGEPVKSRGGLLTTHG